MRSGTSGHAPEGVDDRLVRPDASWRRSQTLRLVREGSEDARSAPQLNPVGRTLRTVAPLGLTARRGFVLPGLSARCCNWHPAAQRLVSHRLLSSTDDGRQVLLTTHSPVVVEEAGFGDVVLCRSHEFYEPNEQSEPTRADINTALLNGFGAEMVFGRAVLLVEGEGDRLFFERLRRRLARLDMSGQTDSCFVVPVCYRMGGSHRRPHPTDPATCIGFFAPRPCRAARIAAANQATSRSPTERFGKVRRTPCVI